MEEKKNFNLFTTNYTLVAAILGLALASSAGLAIFVKMKTGVSGYAWITASLIWGAVLAGLIYMEKTQRDETALAAIIESTVHFILLFIATLIIQFFVGYNLYYGIAVFALYTLHKIMSSTHPMFQVADKIIYSNLKAVQAMENSGQWMDDDDEEEGGSGILPSPDSGALEGDPFGTTFLTPADNFKLMLEGKKEAKFRVKLDGNTGRLQHLEFNDEEIEKEKTAIRLEATELLGIRQGEEMPEELEGILVKIESQIVLRPEEHYVIPDDVSKSGVEELPEPPSAPIEYEDVDTLEKAKLLLMTVRKDMVRLFNMKLRAPVELTVDFPWEIQKNLPRNKLSSKSAFYDRWIINIVGGLKEDLTYALLASNLADIWFEETADKKSEDLKVGFRFWVVYKLTKDRGYVDVALKSARQKPVPFGVVRLTEEEVGEYGVLHKIVYNRYPDYFHSVDPIDEEELFEKVIEEEAEKITVTPVDTELLDDEYKPAERPRRKSLPDVIPLEINRSKKEETLEKDSDKSIPEITEPSSEAEPEENTIEDDESEDTIISELPEPSPDESDLPPQIEDVIENEKSLTESENSDGVEKENDEYTVKFSGETVFLDDKEVEEKEQSNESKKEMLRKKFDQPVATEAEQYIPPEDDEEDDETDPTRKKLRQLLKKAKKDE